MKKLILIIAVLFSITSFSQEIKMERGKFFVDGQQISTRDTKKMLEANPQALALFKKGKSKESTGGLLIGVGVALTVVDLVKGLVSDLKYPSAATYIGIGALAVSIPVMIGKNKKMHDGIDMYNAGLKSTGNNSDLELNLISNQNGYGVQIRF